MKNLTHAMKDMNITDSLKASVFYLGKNFTSCSFRWLGRGLEHLISHRNLEYKQQVENPFGG